MNTTVLGVRLTEPQREKLKVLASENKMKEVELVRFVCEKLIDGSIYVEHGQIYERH